MTSLHSLPGLGWSAFFMGQLSLDELAQLSPVRLTSVARDRAAALGTAGPVTLAYPQDIGAGDTAVGDWVLADPTMHRIVRVLDRKSELGRKSAGRARRQLIAANVDTLFIVTSCNADFNVPRIERYLALALESGITPVVVLTKADLAGAADDYLARAGAVSPRIADVIAVNALSPDAADRLGPWMGRAQTVAFTGSSGVGKSTLISSLTGQDIATAAIREDDAKGRHTTTARALLPTPGGAWVIDTPGMRELGLHDVADGIDEVFEDILTLARSCRFRDCAHGAEPGCAVQAAIAEGRLEAARLDRWRKLRREDARNTEAVHERRERFRAFGRMVKEAKDRKRQDRDA